MAYALSHIFSLQRGSVGGITYFANQFHQICMRQRTSPVQPNTAYQVGVRTAFDQAEALWDALSPAARDDWQFYANSCIYPGPAGPYTVPGRQLMIGTIALAAYANAINPGIFSMTTLAPVISGWYNPGPITVAGYGGLAQGIGIEVQNDTGREGIAVVDVSIGFNLTRNRYKGPWISSAKTVIAVATPGLTHIDIDRPAGTLDKIIFSRSRLFSAGLPTEPVEHHSLAFPVILRHVCEEVPPPGSAQPKKKKGKTDE